MTRLPAAFLAASIALGLLLLAAVASGRFG